MPSKYIALRLYSADTTGTPQSVNLIKLLICNDPCNGMCDASLGLVCDVSTKTCACQNTVRARQWRITRVTRADAVSVGARRRRQLLQHARQRHH
jgi:hypothetical protein